MKFKSKLCLASFLLVAPLGLHAITAEQAYVDQYRHREHWQGPVPLAVRSPDISNAFAGTHLLIEFNVDGNGRTSHFRSGTPGADPQLIETVEQAVRSWEFAPGLKNGVPVSYHVTLPVEIVASRDQ